MPFDLKTIYDRVHFEEVHAPLGMLESFLEGHSVNLDPDYQREHVWTVEQAGKFVAHIFEGGDMHRLLIATEDGLNYEILDGKQRLHALRRWLRNEIPMLPILTAPLYRNDCDPESVAVQCRRIHVPFGRIKQSRVDTMRLYIRLNRGGTVHTNEEIERVQLLLKHAQVYHHESGLLLSGRTK